MFLEALNTCLPLNGDGVKRYLARETRILFFLCTCNLSPFKSGIGNMAPKPPDTEAKPPVEHNEIGQHGVVLKSDHDVLGIWDTVKKFKKVGNKLENGCSHS